MIYPTIKELTKDEFNRYELSIATAKCARVVTDEYVAQREAAEKTFVGTKDSAKPITNMIEPTIRDEKAVKIAIDRIYRGEYKIVKEAPEAPEYEAVEVAEQDVNAAE
jgi:DNA-directed RNA polymerase subunit K/omega